MGMAQRAGDFPAQHACIAARLARLASRSWRHVCQRRHLGSAYCPARPQFTYQHVGKQEYTPPQLPSIKELTDNLE
jgi:hypothetical protein